MVSFNLIAYLPNPLRDPGENIMKFIIKSENSGNVQNALNYINNLDCKKSWVITINRYVDSRSIRQNKALFGYAYPILEAHTGFLKDDLHEHFCMKFFGTMEHIVFGRRKFLPIRTTTKNEYGQADTLSKEEFSKFFQLVQSEAAAIGCDIPDPQQQPDW